MTHRTILPIVLAGLLGALDASVAGELLDAETVLQRSPLQAPRQQAADRGAPATALLADSEAFRRDSTRLEPAQAAVAEAAKSDYSHEVATPDLVALLGGQQVTAHCRPR